MSGSTLAPSSSQSTMPPPRRAPAIPTSSQNYASPTESEFSDADGPDSVKNWDEDKVGEYLRSIKCGDYEKLFRKNHINGENLLEMDKEVLKEMGIDKVGDRVRLFLGIKKLRTKAYANQKKRNRVSFTASEMLELASDNILIRIPSAGLIFTSPLCLVVLPDRQPAQGRCLLHPPSTSAFLDKLTCLVVSKHWQQQPPVLIPR